MTIRGDELRRAMIEVSFLLKNDGLGYEEYDS